MEKKTIVSNGTLATGFAMFSMFFGAGNVVFPLSIGQFAKNQNIFAILGLLLTAVGVPFIGLIGMTLYDGNYKRFFERIGKVPGFIVSLVIMGLIGPFGAIPRCIALSFSTTQLFFPSLSLQLFSLISCVLIFLFSYKRSSIIDVLGYILTPILLGSLGVIIVKGLINPPPIGISLEPSLSIFLRGLKEGYQTMDLLGAFFFSSVIVLCLKKNVDTSEPSNIKKIIHLTLKASFVGASLLALIYIGFSFVSAYHSENLTDIPKDILLGSIALKILGPYAGIFACLAVVLACLTTAIALTAVSAEFIHKDITKDKLNYQASLFITLAISYWVSTLNFTGIVKMLAPILEILYPALIVLTIVNILYKLYRFEPVKLPVFATFILTLIFYFFY